MRIACPHCRTRYELPESLMGAGGAKVRCPACQESFIVAVERTPEGEGAHLRPAPESPAPAVRVETEVLVPPSAAMPAPTSAAASSAPAAVAPQDDAAGVARQVLDELERTHGEAIGQAIRRGRLFSEQGQHLVDAFDEYRKRTLRKADAAPFRQLLRERWGVDLTPNWTDD